MAPKTEKTAKSASRRSAKKSENKSARKPHAVKGGGKGKEKASSVVSAPANMVAEEAVHAPEPVQEPTPEFVAEFAPEPEITTPEDLRRREYLEEVALRSGLRKNQVKPVLEAALEVLGETLASGRGTNLPGLGKFKVNRSKDVGRAQVMVCRLRRPHSTQD